jgi:hypothetical protein
MLVILVLSQKSDSRLGIELIGARHVEIIKEVDELELARWAVSNTSLLLDVLHEDHLEEVSISVVVEVDTLLDVVIRGRD